MESQSKSKKRTCKQGVDALHLFSCTVNFTESGGVVVSLRRPAHAC